MRHLAWSTPNSHPTGDEVVFRRLSWALFDTVHSARVTDEPGILLLYLTTLRSALGQGLDDLRSDTRGQAFAEHWVHLRHLSDIGDEAQNYRVSLPADNIVTIEHPVIVLKAAWSAEETG